MEYSLTDYLLVLTHLLSSYATFYKVAMEYSASKNALILRLNTSRCILTLSRTPNLTLTLTLAL